MHKETIMALTREQILGVKDFTIESVEVPEWGGLVYLRSLKGKGRDAFEGSRVRITDEKKVEMVHDNTRARLLSMTLCDEQGTLLFSEEDVEILGDKNAAVLDKLFEVAQRMSGLRPQDVEAKVKNSAAVHNGSLSSVSL